MSAAKTKAAPPFFLVGSERSGTTLLRLMLSHHPRIECAPEFEFLVERMTNSGGWPGVEEYAAWLETNRVFVPHDLVIDRALPYPELARSFLDQFCERSAKPARGATCHKHFDRLVALWPDARFVHLLRDGRDVARSCIGMGWAGNVWTGAQRWIDAERLWDGVVRDVPAERRIEVRYEELITAPEPVLGRLTRFLGYEYDAHMLDYDQTSTYERPDPSRVEPWRTQLDADELGLLEARIGRLLRERGYPKSGVPAARVGAARRFCLALQDRLFRFRFRFQRYGLGLMLKGRLANSLGWKRLEQRVIVARNRIDDRHIR